MSDCRGVGVEGASCVTASVTVAKQGEFKELESKKNLEGWPKWEILVSDQTTKITEVNLVSISAIRKYVALLWEQSGVSRASVLFQ